MRYDTDGEERLLTGHTGRLFLLLTVTLVVLKLAQRLFPPLLPVIIDDLAITPFAAGVALSVLRLARATMQYPGGSLADGLTRTSVVLSSLGLALVGLAALALANTYAVLLVGIVLFGSGLGLYSPASRALLSDLFHEKRGRAFGLHTMGSDLSGILAAGVAVWIVAIATWRAAFLPLLLVLLPIPVVLVLLSREPVSTAVSDVEFDVRATAGRLFGDSRMRWVVLAYALYLVAGSGVGSFLPAFLAEVHGFSFALASSSFALLYTVGIVAKPAAGTVSDRFPRLLVAGSSLAVAAAGLVLLVGAPAAAVAVVGVVVYAVGQRALSPPLQAYLMDQFPADSMGGDFGATRTVYMTVGSLGPAYTGFVASTFGYTSAFASIVLLYLVAGGILVRLSVTE